VKPVCESYAVVEEPKPRLNKPGSSEGRNERQDLAIERGDASRAALAQVDIIVLQFTNFFKFTYIC